MEGGVALLKDSDDFERNGIEPVRSIPKIIRDLVLGYREMFERDLSLSVDEKNIFGRANDVTEKSMEKFAQNKFGKLVAQLNPVFCLRRATGFCCSLK